MTNEEGILLSGKTAKWYLDLVKTHGDITKIKTYYGRLESTVKGLEKDLINTVNERNAALDQNIALKRLTDLENSFQTIKNKLQYYTQLTQIKNQKPKTVEELLEAVDKVLSEKINMLPTLDN